MDPGTTLRLVLWLGLLALATLLFLVEWYSRRGSGKE